MLPQVIKNIPLDFIKKTFEHCYRFMSGYRHGLSGPWLDFAMKTYKSHRRITNDVVTLVQAEMKKAEETANKSNQKI